MNEQKSSKNQSFDIRGQDHLDLKGQWFYIGVYMLDIEHGGVLFTRKVEWCLKEFFYSYFQYCSRTKQRQHI